MLSSQSIFYQSLTWFDSQLNAWVYGSVQLKKMSLCRNIPRLGTWTNTSQACQRVITGNSEPQTQRNFLNSWIQNYLLVTSRWTVIAKYYCGFLKSVKGYQTIRCLQFITILMATWRCSLMMRMMVPFWFMRANPVV